MRRYWSLYPFFAGMIGLCAGCGQVEDANNPVVQNESETDSGSDTGLDSETAPALDSTAVPLDTVVPEDSETSGDLDTVAVSEIDFSAMTWDEIFAYAQHVPISQNGCTSSGGDCRVSFLNGPICTTDGYVVEADGWCDEGGDAGYFCTPNRQNCAEKSKWHCETPENESPKIVGSLGECAVVLDKGPTCVAGNDVQVLMDCGALIGTRHCDHDEKTILEIVEIDCVTTRMAQGDDENNYLLGCVPGTSMNVSVCGETEVCEDDYVSVSFDASDDANDIQDGWEETGAYIRHVVNAQCVEDRHCGDTDASGEQMGCELPE